MCSSDLAIEVFGLSLGERDLDADGGWHTLVLPVPASLRCTPALVNLRVEAWVPRDAGLGDDDRRLGLRVRALRVVDAPIRPMGSP